MICRCIETWAEFQKDYFYNFKPFIVNYNQKYFRLYEQSLSSVNDPAEIRTVDEYTFKQFFEVIVL